MRLDRELEVRVFKQDYGRSVEILPMHEGLDGKLKLGLIGKTGEWVLYDEQDYLISGPEHTAKMKEVGRILTIPDTWARQLRDALVKAYGHPEKDATTQELAATKYHLEDMRRIALKDTPKHD